MSCIFKDEKRRSAACFTYDSVFAHHCALYSYRNYFFVCSGAADKSCRALIGMVIGYCIGRYATSGYEEKMVKKHPKFKEISEKLHSGEWFFTYILRMVPIPNELISMYLGSIKISFGKYFTASLVGTLPMVAVITLIGSNINNLFSPVTASAVAALVALMVISSLLHKYYPKISEILHRR